MLAVELKFESKTQGAYDAKIVAIGWLIATLVRYGSLLEDFLVGGNLNEWLVYGIAPARDAFDKADCRSLSAEMRRKCPGCRGPWLLKKPLHGKFDFRCDKCHLLSNIAWNIR